MTIHSQPSDLFCVMPWKADCCLQRSVASGIVPLHTSPQKPVLKASPNYSCLVHLFCHVFSSTAILDKEADFIWAVANFFPVMAQLVIM